MENDLLQTSVSHSCALEMNTVTAGSEAIYESAIVSGRS